MLASLVSIVLLLTEIVTIYYGLFRKITSSHKIETGGTAGNVLMFSGSGLKFNSNVSRGDGGTLTCKDIIIDETLSLNVSTGTTPKTGTFVGVSSDFEIESLSDEISVEPEGNLRCKRILLGTDDDLLEISGSDLVSQHTSAGDSEHDMMVTIKDSKLELINLPATVSKNEIMVPDTDGIVAFTATANVVTGAKMDIFPTDPTDPTEKVLFFTSNSSSRSILKRAQLKTSVPITFKDTNTLETPIDIKIGTQKGLFVVQNNVIKNNAYPPVVSQYKKNKPVLLGANDKTLPTLPLHKGAEGDLLLAVSADELRFASTVEADADKGRETTEKLVGIVTGKVKYFSLDEEKSGILVWKNTLYEPVQHTQTADDKMCYAVESVHEKGHLAIYTGGGQTDVARIGHSPFTIADDLATAKGTPNVIAYDSKNKKIVASEVPVVFKAEGNKTANVSVGMKKGEIGATSVGEVVLKNGIRFDFTNPGDGAALAYSTASKTCQFMRPFPTPTRPGDATNMFLNAAGAFSPMFLTPPCLFGCGSAVVTQIPDTKIGNSFQQVASINKLSAGTTIYAWCKAIAKPPASNQPADQTSSVQTVPVVHFKFDGTGIISNETHLLCDDTTMQLLVCYMENETFYPVNLVAKLVTPVTPFFDIVNKSLVKVF